MQGVVADPYDDLKVCRRRGRAIRSSASIDIMENHWGINTDRFFTTTNAGFEIPSSNGVESLT